MQPDHDLKLPAALRLGFGAPVGQLFDAFAPAARQAIARIASLRSLRAGETLVAAGAVPRHLGYVLTGTLGMKKTLPDGRAHIIGLLLPTDMFGRIFDGGSGYALEALTDAEVFCLERLPFERILRGEPAIERAFLVNVLDELDAARAWIMLMSGRRVLDRLAAFLLLLAQRGSGLRAAAGPDTVPATTVQLPVRQVELAQHLGARPESLSRALHALQARGVIRSTGPRQLQIIDHALLAELAGQGTGSTVRR